MRHRLPSNATPSASERCDQPAELARVHAVELVAELLGQDLGVRAAARLADFDEARDIADERRVDVLIGPLDLRSGTFRGRPSLIVGEGRAADVRLVIVRRDVGDLGDVARQL